ncbi:hypothetical protein IEQ34_016075 [Dendrobium chrysotoxum]|uniref:Uncharacterized protein n=1 Tax=Dendrobium chrysotoxum TaxID=161865 RepID=A0AAV7GCH3_DENCH|nr:hypothetical protein IEQ34_016075 [Dendrobium chrysotoxum]
MEFPFGHGHGHHHHHRHHGDEDEDDRRRHQHAGVYPPPGIHDRGYDPPPPFASGSAHHVSHEPGPAYPPPGVTHAYPPPGVHHASHDRGYDPPPPFFGGSAHHVSHEPGLGYGPPPPLITADVVPPPPRPFAGAPVQHVSHETPYGHRPGYAEHVSHESWDGGALNNLPTVRIFTKAEENYSLSIRDGKVVLELKNPSDKRQHWIKDLKYSTKVKDKEGFPAFAIVNKATGEAVKHSLGATKPVS